MRSPSVVIVLLTALGLGAFAGYMDLVHADLTLTMVILIIGMVIIGFADPVWWWLAALVSGLSVVAAHIFQLATGHPATATVEPDFVPGLLAIMPALIGGLTGAALRTAGRRQQ